MIITHLLNISLADGEVIKIEPMNEKVKISYKTWNENLLVIEFIGYIRMIDNRSIGNDVEHIQVDDSEDLRTIMIEFDSITEDELSESKKYSFISSWGDYSLLTIYAKNIKVLSIVEADNQ